jgi:hypothetical protein
MAAMSRWVPGVLLIVAAPATIAVGYANAPSASACSRINDLSEGMGLGPTCATTPPVGYFVAAGLLLLAGLLVVIPWWRRLTEE